jgi:hypothetical protein
MQAATCMQLDNQEINQQSKAINQIRRKFLEFQNQLLKVNHANSTNKCSALAPPLVSTLRALCVDGNWLEPQTW